MFFLNSVNIISKSFNKTCRFAEYRKKMLSSIYLWGKIRTAILITPVNFLNEYSFQKFKKFQKILIKCELVNQVL